MNENEYVEQRLQDQIDWYDRKSLSSQQAFRRMRKFEIVAAAIIPLLSGLSASNPEFTMTGSVLAGFLGVGVAVIAGFLALGQHQEHWIEYRTTCESLKKEKFMFLAQVEPYDGEDAFKVLVQRVETLVSKENTNWAQYMMKPEESASASKG